MTVSRASQVHVPTTPYYHCVSRCVRRAFLCGDDRYSGQNFDHRKAWLVERLRHLSGLYAIDVCAYAIQANHFHLVLRVAPERVEAWDEDEVVQRYGKLFPMAKAELASLSGRARDERLALWRARLSDLSWMMRSLNEWIARRANKEDGCSGRFWEGRFKSQALLDEAGLLTCMMYVDLNPVRAGVATSLETSDFTSIQKRLEVAHAELEASRKKTKAPKGLVPFADQSKRGDTEPLPMRLVDYVAILDWTGRALRDGKRGAIRGAPPEALTRLLGADAEAWLRTMESSGLQRIAMLGRSERAQEEATRRGQRHAGGQRWARRLFRDAA